MSDFCYRAASSLLSFPSHHGQGELDRFGVGFFRPDGAHSLQGVKLGGCHASGQARGFLTHGGHTLADEAIEVALQAARGIFRDPAAVFGDFKFSHAFRNLQPDAVGRGDLEQPGLEGEPFGDVPGGRERLLDGGDQALDAENGAAES